jgi:hypothetical protein
MKPHNYSHLIFDKDAKNISWRKEMLLEKVVIHLQKSETRSMLIVLYWYQLKMDQGP